MSNASRLDGQRVTDHEILLVLRESTQSLCAFLEKALPALDSGDWWRSRVLNRLTPQQVDNVQRRRISSLTGLDMAALLRILDQNWNDLSHAQRWPREVRNYVKEAQALRNRWAHLGSESRDAEDIYRDLDTLQRLVQALDDDERAADIGQIKRRVLVAGLAGDAPPQPEPARPPRPTATASPEEQTGDTRRPTPASPRPSSGRPVFLLELGKTYYTKGFFNVSVDYERYVQTRDGEITLILGDGDRFIRGHSSRKANPGTGAPRIFGRAALRDWFQQNFRLSERVEVHFEAPDRIRLRRPG